MAENFTEISPAILYWGTPVCLITTTNPDGSHNIGPIPSIFWLSHSCMIGLDASSQTTGNIQRNGHCTLNLPSDDMKHAVNAIARTTGSSPVPDSKQVRGYTHVKDKFRCANVTPLPSLKIASPGITECPVVMEAELVNTHKMFKGLPIFGGILVFELRIVNVRIHRGLKLDGYQNRVDAEKWKPMIMMFSELYGLREGKLVESKLAKIEEECTGHLPDLRLKANTYKRTHFKSGNDLDALNFLLVRL
ncbi:uncharacterized protein PV09_06564 [Verruconis gallopava]|uniref:Flavin reductase like domain-containing protein n=1 Tax=Verruconis gallopava TaxID=253628 RepID=A0A0D2ASC9_9PEZI|nr:uncharacterized protein PV09_06564 [Verruconis gallopava]KIW02069.1 hypothetical protein PV09_06564 [Verruconis gallopava]